MATVLLQARSNKPGSSPVTLVDGLTATGYRLGAGTHQPDWGNAIWESFFSGIRGTQGRKVAGSEPQDRQLLLPIGIIASTSDAMHAAASVLWDLDEELRRFQGVITWRPEGATFKQYFDVLSCSARIADYDWFYHNQHVAVVELAPLCAPLLRCDPMDIFDGFDTNTAADYTKDADGALLTIKGGQLVPSQTGTSRWRHTARGYSYGDQEATIKVTTGSTVTNLEVGVTICADTGGADTYLRANLWSNTLRIDKVTTGSVVNLVNTAFTVNANTTYWLRIRREGRRLTASVYVLEPSPLLPPDATCTYTLTVVENWAFAFGHTGLRPVVVSTGERYDDFRVEPYTYNPASLPDQRALRPAIVGDAPALVDLTVAHGDGTGSAPIFCLASWWERPSVWNYVWNGDFEDDVDGWSVAAVAGVTGAATSIARSTVAARTKYGIANGQVVCPATANTGATFKIRQRFYQGRDYILLVWASSAAGTTLVRARLGVSGDIANSGTPALTTIPTLMAATWSPTADRDGAYVAVEITAATGTTWNIDGVVVIEARPASLTNLIASGDTSCVVDRIPEDWPPAPFLAVLDPLTARELVRVESIAVSTRTLQITRGVEGSIAAGHASGMSLMPLPELRPHLEGKGAPPALGILEAEGCDTGNLSTWAIASSGSYRSGEYLNSGAIAGAGNAFADWLIDPNLLVPDDYAGLEIAVEVWARIVLHGGLASAKALLTLTPENSTVSAGTITSLYGHKRYPEEWGSTLRDLPLTNVGSQIATLFRLGTLRMVVDRSRPLRSRLGLKVTWTYTSGSPVFNLDYLLLAPKRGSALSPTGQYYDANYPEFISGIQETIKTIRSDASGLVARGVALGVANPAYPDHGLGGGGLLEIPAGPVDALLKLSSSPPDEPIPGTSEQLAHTVAAHYAITPRFRTART
jgi:hypothetical protein